MEGFFCESRRKAREAVRPVPTKGVLVGGLCCFQWVRGCGKRRKIPRETARGWNGGRPADRTATPLVLRSEAHKHLLRENSLEVAELVDEMKL